jgi:hypothetical protein
MRWLSANPSDTEGIDCMRSRKKTRLGKQDRWPSDYGVRDEDDRRAKHDDADRSWLPGDNGTGAKGSVKPTAEALETARVFLVRNTGGGARSEGKDSRGKSSVREF